VILQISRVLILSHLWWGRMYVLLGIRHTLVCNRVLQHIRGWLLQILLWGLLRGRRCWRIWRIHGVFHPFEVINLGEMVSIMTMLTAMSAREVHPDVVIFVPPLAFVVIVPLGVLVTLILVAPSRLVLLGFISPWSWVIIVSVFSFIFVIIRLMGWICCIQKFKSMKFLNGRGLNKVNVGMWLALWRTRKWKIWIVSWQRFVGCIGRRSAFTSAQVL
jgi:hypothetical protein